MEYKLPIFLGVIAIILYFDFGRGPREQFFQFIATSTKGLPASEESVLSNNYHEYFKDRKPWAKNAFIGFNGNVDVILNGAELLSKLTAAEGEAKDHNDISSLEALKEVFMHYFITEAAAERVVSNQETWDVITAAIQQMENKQHFIGGNAALMARTMKSYGIEISLAVPAGPELRALLAKSGVSVLESCVRETDELHVIMEYSRGEEIGGYTAKRANRFIFSRDIANGEMQAVQCLTDGMASSDLVVIAGFHMLEPQSATMQAKVLEDVLSAVSSHALVHLELASMTDGVFLKTLFIKLALQVHSLGLNEAELEFLSSVLGGPAVNVKEAQSVKQALVFVLQAAGDSTLTRIHFHCLTYHIIVEKPGAWKDNSVAVAAGTYAAARYACDTPTLQPELHHLRHDQVEVVVSEQLGPYTLHTSPVLVCIDAVKTVGLGDSISATALIYSSRVE